MEHICTVSDCSDDHIETDVKMLTHSKCGSSWEKTTPTDITTAETQKNNIHFINMKLSSKA